jgi:hypothetical protein
MSPDPPPRWLLGPCCAHRAGLGRPAAGRVWLTPLVPPPLPQPTLDSYRRAWRSIRVAASGLDNRIVRNGAPPPKPLSDPTDTPDSSIAPKPYPATHSRPYQHQEALIIWPGKRAEPLVSRISSLSGLNTVVDFAEAITDATTGEFVRLNKFGIKRRWMSSRSHGLSAIRRSTSPTTRRTFPPP